MIKQGQTHQLLMYLQLQQLPACEHELALLYICVWSCRRANNTQRVLWGNLMVTFKLELKCCELVTVRLLEYFCFWFSALAPFPRIDSASWSSWMEGPSFILAIFVHIPIPQMKLICLGNPLLLPPSVPQCFHVTVYVVGFIVLLHSVMAIIRVSCKACWMFLSFTKTAYTCYRATLLDVNCTCRFSKA